MLHRLFFNLWYFLRPPWDTGITPPEVMAFLADHPAGRALDLGCGSGTNAITLAQHGWQTTGVDFAQRAIQRARQKARRAGLQVDFFVDDVTRLEGIRGPFDLILDIGCFHGLSAQNQRIYADNLKRLLAPQGFFLLYGFFRNPGDSGPGMLEADLGLFAAPLQLLARSDSSDRLGRPSVWLTYQMS